MSSYEHLSAIFDRIVNGEETPEDIQTMRSLLRLRDGQNVVQVGNNIVNIAEGQDIQIGDRIYQGADAKTIKAIVEAIWQKWTETHTSAEIDLNSQPSDRLIRLEELKRESRAWCIERFRIFVSSKEEAVSLADDLLTHIPHPNWHIRKLRG